MIFIIGNLWFWILISLALFLEIGFIELWINKKDEEPNGQGATIVIIGTFLILFFFGSKKEVKDFVFYIINNPLKDVFYFFVYTFIGVIWSFFKWFQYIIKLKREYQERISSFTEDSVKNSSWQQSVLRDIPNPKATSKKSAIFTWIFYWPFSVIGYILNDPIKKFFNFIFNNIKGLYQRITDKVLADISTPKI